MADVATAIDLSEEVRPALSTGRLWGLRMGSLLLGFIAGAVFWHLVGFWDFVTKIVLADGSLTPAVQQEVDVAALSVAEANCVALSIDRMRGETLSTDCLGDDVRLHATAHERGDLLPIARSRSGFQPASRGHRISGSDPLQK